MCCVSFGEMNSNLTSLCSGGVSSNLQKMTWKRVVCGIPCCHKVPHPTRPSPPPCLRPSCTAVGAGLCAPSAKRYPAMGSCGRVSCQARALLVGVKANQACPGAQTARTHCAHPWVRAAVAPHTTASRTSVIARATSRHSDSLVAPHDLLAAEITGGVDMGTN